METLKQAIAKLHEIYRLPHIMITSVSLPAAGDELSLSVVGSTFTSSNTPRIFRIKIPAFDCFFSGTGDMFAALMVVRLREAVYKTEGLTSKTSWVSDDDVQATDLPLARAAEKVLASMHEVLTRTKIRADQDMEKYRTATGDRAVEKDEKTLRLVRSKAVEVRLVRNLDCLMNPDVKFRAHKV